MSINRLINRYYIFHNITNMEPVALILICCSSFLLGIMCDVLIPDCTTEDP